MGSPSIPALLLAATAAFSVAPVPGVENHWVANSYGNVYSHIQNFIEDMTVKADGTVLTQSFYDEGQYPNSTYKDGARTGYNWETDTTNPHPSRNATYHGRKWRIANFYGRAFMFKQYPAPTKGDSVPLVVSDAGDTIRSVRDPTALAFDSSGRLLVGDNGADQNIKVFRVPTPEHPDLAIRLVDSIGEKGGVFAGPVRGAVGPRRFWGIRGIGVDSTGRLYVGCTGMPMQVGGGTHIRCFSDLSAKTLVWEVIGVAFVNTVDADPDSGGTSLHKNSVRFHMDWSKPPGKSWSFASVTTDPFAYPDDPRLDHSLESVWFRRVHGKRYLYLDDMYGSFLAVIRFEENSEVGIPTAFYPILNSYWDSSSGDWALDRRPIGLNKGSDANLRWMWRDDNGDGQVQTNEFHFYKLTDHGSIIPFPYTLGIDVDDSGDIWWGGKPYMVQFPAGSMDDHGVAKYSTDSIRLWTNPYSDSDAATYNDYVLQCRYLKSQDAMILAAGVHEGLAAALFRYDHWSDSTRRALRWKTVLPYRFPSDWSVFRDGASMDTLLFPNNMTADTDYVYVGYVDKGPDGRRNGEVSLYRVDDGQRVGWIAPGPETNFMAGWFDLWHALNACTMPNGEKLLMTEEDYAGKVNVYRWCPRTTCSPVDSSSSNSGASPRVFLAGGRIHVVAMDGMPWSLNVDGIGGRQLLRWSGTGSASSAFHAGGAVVYAEIRSLGTSRAFALIGR